jgi:hypothetical protein
LWWNWWKLPMSRNSSGQFPFDKAIVTIELWHRVCFGNSIREITSNPTQIILDNMLITIVKYVWIVSFRILGVVGSS